MILDPAAIPDGLDDSKRLTAARREELARRARRLPPSSASAVASVAEIEAMNILQASFLAMRRAVAAPRAAARRWRWSTATCCRPACPAPAAPIVGGDGLALSIAAASIVAKVTRDRMMVALSQQFPGYGWETNMGYGTRGHAEGLARLGVTPHHRRSFRADPQDVV